MSGHFDRYTQSAVWSLIGAAFWWCQAVSAQEVKIDQATVGNCAIHLALPNPNPKHLEFSTIWGANHGRHRTAFFVIEPFDQTGAISNIPDFVPKFIKWKRAEVIPQHDFDQIPADQQAVLRNAQKVDVLPYFTREGSLFCMRQFAQLPTTITRDGEQIMRYWFFPDFGAPVSATLIVGLKPAGP